ncbi:MAG: ABC transporter permease [Clostridia bacterium]|nr:ABC transporter permease [Clostridia bacterium]
MLAFLVSTIRLGMTFLLGSTGETITEKSGHLNLGTPGVMCVGASCGCFVEYLYFTAVGIPNINPVLAVIFPMLASFFGAALMGAIFSFLTVTLRVNQNVTGLALTTFGVGISDYMIAQTGIIYTRGTKYFTAHLPVADDLGWFGEIFLSHGILIYLAIVIALITTFVFNRTRVGLHLRAVGENPATADAAGINVSAYRYAATCIGCGISGLGGLSFIMDYLYGNWEYCVDDIGWLVVALVIFTVWKPNLGIIGSLVFGALYVASSYITGVSLEDKEIFKMLPYVVTILVLVVTSIRSSKKNQPPASLGLNYFREER